jgi:hypothetical protein
MNEKKLDRLHIDKKDKDLYEYLKNEIFRSSDLKENKNLFLFALSIGFNNNAEHPINTKLGFVRAEYLQPKDEALINAIALHTEKTVKVLSNKEDVYKIAEEFAHGGIRILYDEVTSKRPGSFYKRFEKEMYDLRKQLIGTKLNG